MVQAALLPPSRELIHQIPILRQLPFLLTIPKHFKEVNAEVLQLQKLTRSYKLHYTAIGILLT